MSLLYQYKPCCTLGDWYLHLRADVSDSLWLTAWNDFLYSPKVLSVCFHLRILNQSFLLLPPSSLTHTHTHTHTLRCEKLLPFLASKCMPAFTPSLTWDWSSPVNRMSAVWVYSISISQPRLIRCNCGFWINKVWRTWLHYLIWLCGIIPSIFSAETLKPMSCGLCNSLLQQHLDRTHMSVMASHLGLPQTILK